MADLENRRPLPLVAVQHINHPRLADHYEEIYVDLEKTQSRTLNKLIWRVYWKEIKLEDFLKQARGLNLPDFEKKIFPGLLRYDFLPLADYLEINIQDWLKYLLEKEKADFKIVYLSEWAVQYNVEKNFGLNEPEQKRLAIALKSFLQGMKEEKTITESLSRPEKVGGIEISVEMAEKILEDFKKRIEESMEKDEIVTAQEVKVEELRIMNSELRTFSSAKPTLKPQPTEKIQSSEFKVQSSKFIPSTQLFDQTAEDLIKQSGLPMAPELRQRFKIIVISRLKEVRKISETRERLMAAPVMGGVGLKPEEAEKVMKMVEELRTLNSELRTLNSELRTPNLEEKREEIRDKRDEIKDTRDKIQDTKKIPSVEELVQPATKDFLPPKPLPAPLPKKEIRPFPPSARPSFRSVPATSSDIKKAPPTAVKIISQEKAPAKVELTLPRLPPPKPALTLAIPETSAGRAKIEDVFFKPRLVGPIEELKGLTLVDFHRLAPQPRVSADKIYAKIELLAEEGYEKRLQGIKAWQAGPVNRLYLEILNESLLKAAPISQIIAEKKNSRQETLSEEEFKTVTELNRKLRY